MFTKQHYEKIAKILAHHNNFEKTDSRAEDSEVPWTELLLVEITESFCNMLGEDNENFDREKFHKAVWKE